MVALSPTIAGTVATFDGLSILISRHQAHPSGWYRSLYTPGLDDCTIKVAGAKSVKDADGNVLRCTRRVRHDPNNGVQRIVTVTYNRHVIARFEIIG